MKKIVLSLAIAAIAAAGNAASVKWRSGVIIGPDNMPAPAGSVTAYLWVVDAATYETFAANTTGAAMSEAVYGAFGGKLTEAYASAASADNGVDLIDDSKSYGPGDSAYAVLLYTYGTGDNFRYIGNAGMATINNYGSSPTSGKMAINLFGSVYSQPTAWSPAVTPEPTSALLLLLGTAALALKRKRA